MSQKKSRNRRRNQQYTAEFRAEALKLVESQPQLSIAAIAEQLGMNKGTLWGWHKDSRRRAVQGSQHGPRAAQEPEEAPLDESERAELERLRKANVELERKAARLEMEREILKKATAFFAKESE